MQYGQTSILLSISSPQAKQTILLVGHNPGLSLLATYFQKDTQQIAMSPASIYGFAVACEHWSEFANSCSKAIYKDHPDHN